MQGRGKQVPRYTCAEIAPPHLVMRALHAKEVVLEVATSLGQLEQLPLIKEGTVQMRHHSPGDVRPWRRKRETHIYSGQRKSPSTGPEACSTSSISKGDLSSLPGWMINGAPGVGQLMG